jgi:Tol biopolymer transport system component
MARFGARLVYPVGKAMKDAGRDRLDSWKEIASFLDRGIRTVQRWEREEGLPVRRLAHAKRGSVYADRAELTAWWESRRLVSAASAGPSVVDVPAERRLERLTNTSATTFYPALSSDARLLAFISDSGQDGAAPQVWVQQIGGQAIRLTTNQRDCVDASFSADDTRILYTARADTTQNVYSVPTLGGTPRLLKRGARGARMSPDGRWLAYLSLEPPAGLRISRLDSDDERSLATDFVDVSSVTWLPDNTHVLIQARMDQKSEPEYWVVPIGGGPIVNTGMAEGLRRLGFLVFLPLPPTWMRDALVFSAVTRDGVAVWRQRLSPETFAPIGAPERITRGTESGWFSAAAAGRLAFVSTHSDINLWSVGLDEATGSTLGPLRRLTRGPGILGFLSLTANGHTLAYFSVRLGSPEVFLRDLDNGSETVLAADPAHAGKGYPAISPNGRQVAYATMSAGPRAMRPVFIASMPDGASRQVCEDCGGRPRQWLDERHLLVETFGARLNTLLVIDTATGEARELVADAEQSVTNPRISPDGHWIAFDAARPGELPAVFVASLSAHVPIPASAWILIDRAASHPFWSRDGHLLYYLSTTPFIEIRREVRARRFTAASKQPAGESFVLLRLDEVMLPAYLAGTAPIAAPDQILFPLGDFRGDIWMTNL